MRILSIAGIMSVIAVGVLAADDTPANREKEAIRYLEATPPVDLVAAHLPETGRAEFKQLLTKHGDMKAVNQIVKDATVKHFTADELKALADFYGSPAGKSAMKKFSPYMADVMPAIQAELIKAKAEAIKEQIEADRRRQAANQ